LFVFGKSVCVVLWKILDGFVFRFVKNGLEGGSVFWRTKDETIDTKVRLDCVCYDFISARLSPRVSIPSSLFHSLHIAIDIIAQPSLETPRFLHSTCSFSLSLWYR
jgi:hypothetical protein